MSAALRARQLDEIEVRLTLVVLVMAAVPPARSVLHTVDALASPARAARGRWRGCLDASMECVAVFGRGSREGELPAAARQQQLQARTRASWHECAGAPKRLRRPLPARGARAHRWPRSGLHRSDRSERHCGALGRRRQRAAAAGDP